MTDVRIDPALEHLLTPIDELHEHPANPRRGDVPAIVDSMRVNGVYRPVYVQQSTGHIVAGNHSYRAMVELGLTYVPAIKLNIDNEQALRIVLADNRIAELGEYDVDQLVDLLVGFAETELDLAGTGWDDEALADLLEQNTADLEDDVDDDEQPTQPEGRSFDVFDRDVVLDAAHAHYLGQYPYRDLAVHEQMQEINALAALSDDKLRTTTLGYATADTYHKHRLRANAVDMISPVDAIADPARLRHGLDLIVEADQAITDAAVRTVCNFVHGAQACANFRPGFALWLYRKYAKPGDVVLDTSTGYGGRLIGFLASDCAAYIGVDPNIDTHTANLMIADELGGSKQVRLINLPAEDVDSIAAESCDFAFTSPPYFSKEHYSDDDTQSYKRYPTIDAWREGFLLPMLRLQYATLKPGSYNVINIADVIIKGQTYDLTTMTQLSARAVNFEWVEWDFFPLGQKRVPGAGERREAVEPLLVFRKPA